MDYALVGGQGNIPLYSILISPLYATHDLWRVPFWPFPNSNPDTSPAESNGIVTHTDGFCKRWFGVGSYWTVFVYASMHCTHLLRSDEHALGF
jgi:hypothetical protein